MSEGLHPKVEGRIAGAFGGFRPVCPYELHTWARRQWYDGHAEGNSAAVKLEEELMEAPVE